MEIKITLIYLLPSYLGWPLPVNAWVWGPTGQLQLKSALQLRSLLLRPFSLVDALHGIPQALKQQQRRQLVVARSSFDDARGVRTSYLPLIVCRSSLSIRVGTPLYLLAPTDLHHSSATHEQKAMHFRVNRSYYLSPPLAACTD